jgi:hypothetical protein
VNNRIERLLALMDILAARAYRALDARNYPAADRATERFRRLCGVIRADHQANLSRCDRWS